MKNMREIIKAVVSSSPKISVISVRADGNVSFKVRIKDCGIAKADYANPVMATKFMVNFIGEFLVRENIEKFSPILTGLDTAMYAKIVGVRTHVDFGMTTDPKLSFMTFYMHLSLVRDIMTEDFRRTEECDSGLISLDDDPMLFDGEEKATKRSNNV